MGSKRGDTPTVPAAAARIAAGIDELCAALDNPDADRSEAAACATMKTLVRLERRLAAVRGKALGTFHAQGAGLHDGAVTTHAWLRHQTGMSPGEATRNVNVARALNALPVAAEAHTAGTLNADQLLLLHRTAEEIGTARFAAAEALMVGQAQQLTLAGLRHALDALKQTIDPDAADRDEARRDNDRELFLAQTLGGIWSLHGTLTPECGASLSTILASISPKPTPDDERSAPQRRHDAAHDLFRHLLDRGDLPTVGGERPHIGVITHLTDITGPDSLAGLNPHCCPTPATCGNPGAPVHGALEPATATDVDATRSAEPGATPSDTDNRGPAVPPRVPHLRHLPRPGQGGVLDGGGSLPSAALQRLACDAAIYRIVFSPAGAILDIGRTQRVVPPWLRRALAARDGGCRFSNCDRPVSWCQAHHVIPWSQGGATSTDNCLLLCSRHHHLVHDGGWRLAFDGTTVTIHRPDGSPLQPP